jgi:surface polysaccharide O-acyltransferase-like enzyme
MTIAKSKRIFYFDALRAFAIICVIVVHVYAVTRMHVMVDYAVIPSFDWIFSQFTGNCFRIGVDLFLMLAGALSLGRVWTIREFLGKRIPRIVGPFVFWGIVTGAIAVIISYYYGFPFVNNFDTYSILNFFKGVFLATSVGYEPYWFFWMILGTYLIMPIFNKWLLHSDLVEAEYFLVFWLITCLFDNTLGMTFPIKLSYFTCPIGLVVAGYYLRHTQRKILTNPYFALVLLILSSAITVILATYLSTASEMYLFDRYSILLCIEVMAVFLLFRNFNKFNINLNFSERLTKMVKKFIFMIAKYSYGIYLIQGLFLCIYREIIPYCGYCSTFIGMFLLILITSMIIMYILEKVPYINKVIGAK